jgi:hypothetical protein
VPAVSPYNPRGYDANNGTPKPWYSVKGYLTDGGAVQTAKKVWMRNADNSDWIEVWNARPIITGIGVTSANDGTNNTKLTFTGTVDPLGFSTSVKVFYRKTGSSAFSVSSTSTISAVFGGQSFSIVISSLSDGTSYDYYIEAVNVGGTSTTAIAATTTNVNCTEGSTGFVSIACTDCSESISQGCGTCGLQYKTRTRTKYGKTGCSNTYYSAYPDYSTIAWSGCVEGNGTWEDVSGDPAYITDGGYWAGIRLRTGYYSIFPFGYDAISTYTNSQCGLGGQCCGGNGIKYYFAERCTQTGAQRWTEIGCYAPY